MRDLDAAEAHLEEAAGLILATPPAGDRGPGPGRRGPGRGRPRPPEQAARLLAAAAATRERAGVAAVGAEAVEAELAGRPSRPRSTPTLAAAEAGGRALATDAALQEVASA